MFQSILVPIDLADTDLAKPAIETAASLSKSSGGTVRLVNVMPERLFFRLVTWALLLISLKLIWDGAKGLI